MEITLRLLLEYIEPEIKEYEISPDLSRKYSRVMLCSDSVPLLSGTVYICRSIPDKKAAKNEGTGFIIVSDEEINPADIKGEYILVRNIKDFSSFFNSVTSAFYGIQEKLNRLLLLMARQASFQELIENIYDIFKNPAYLVDATFKVLAVETRFDLRHISATWRHLEDDGYLPLHLVSGLVKDKELDRIETGSDVRIIRSGLFYTPFINCNLRYHSEVHGHLFIAEMFKKITPGDIELAEIVSGMFMDRLVTDEDFLKTRGMIYENFMKAMFEGRPMDKNIIPAQMRYLNIKPGSVFAVAKIMAPAKHMIGERVAGVLDRLTDVRLVRYEDYIMCLFILPSHNSLAALKKHLEDIAKSWKCAAGLSDCFENAYDMHIYALQAESALRLNKSKEAAVCCYSRYALFDLLDFSSAKKEEFCAFEIKKMLEYDKNNNTEYVRTLKAFIENEESPSETARALNIHRNTLSYRIERMRHFFYLDLESPENRYRYYLSILMSEENPDQYVPIRTEK